MDKLQLFNHSHQHYTSNSQLLAGRDEGEKEKEGESARKESSVVDDERDEPE